MREIKYRFYFIESKTMYSWDEAINRLGLARTSFVETDLWKPMQFTGLKDKNRKEIYEGDIIETRSGIYKVFYKYSNFEPFDGSGDDGCFSDETEIVGNIYETPELLK